MNAALLGFKAEVVLAVQLITRHRAPRLAAFLALIVVLALALGASDEAAGRALLLVAGTLGVAAASRILAPGAALASARRTAAAWWVVPCGRLGGVFLHVGAAVVVAGAILYQGEPAGGAGALVVSAGFGTVAGAVTLALAPRIGSSAAATVAFLPVWFGSFPPERVASLMDAWPRVARGALVAWHILPLPWRAAELLPGAPSGGGMVDVLVLTGWTLGGVALAARAAAQPRGWAVHG